MMHPTGKKLEDNSLLEVYFEYLKLKNRSIKFERVGDSNGDPKFGFYIIKNKINDKFCLAGTNVPILHDKRQRDLNKRRKKSIIFLFLRGLPEHTQYLEDKMFSDINSNNLIEENYIISNEPEEIIRFLS